MLIQQRVARFNLMVVAAAAVLYGALVPVLGAGPALGAFGVCGLMGLGVLFYRRGRNGSKVVLDERDQLVAVRAQILGLWVMWEFLVFGCMATWAVKRYYKHEPTISVDVLPLLLMASFVVLIVSQSIATLVQYGRSHADEVA
jgi:hypothetical protein